MPNLAFYHKPIDAVKSMRGFAAVLPMMTMLPLFCVRTRRRGWRSWRAAAFSTAWACSSLRATASFPLRTPSGTCWWRWRRAFTITPSGGTSTDRRPTATPRAAPEHPAALLPPNKHKTIVYHIPTNTKWRFDFYKYSQSFHDQLNGEGKKKKPH